MRPQSKFSLLLWLLTSVIFAATWVNASDHPDYTRAVAMVQSGKWDQAIGLLDNLLQSTPNNLKVRNLLGLALTGKGDLKKANEEFQAALGIDPGFYPALKNLAINELTLRQNSKAEKHFMAALKLAPHDPVSHAYLGALAFRRAEYKRAADHFREAGPLVLRIPSVRLDAVETYVEMGNEPTALNMLKQMNPSSLETGESFRAGVALARLYQYDEAIPFFRAVYTRFPDSYNTAFNLAICYVQTKRFPAAIEVLNTLRERKLKTAELFNLLATAYEGNKQTQQAIDALREAINLAPMDENNYLDFAALCADYEAYQLAIEILNVGLHYLQDSDRLTFQRGAIFAMMGQLDRAEQDFERASTLAPEKDLAYVGLGIAYMQKSNLPQALEVLRRRTREKPNDYVLQYLLGEALIRHGLSPGGPDMAEAQTALEQSVRLNPSFSRSRIDLGKILLKQNRLEEAIKQLEVGRQLDPNDKAVYSQLAAAYRRKGDDQQTSAMLNMVTKLNDEQREREKRKLLRIVKTESSQELAFPQAGGNEQPSPMPEPERRNLP